MAGVPCSALTGADVLQMCRCECCMQEPGWQTGISSWRLSLSLSRLAGLTIVENAFRSYHFLSAFLGMPTEVQTDHEKPVRCQSLSLSLPATIACPLLLLVLTTSYYLFHFTSMAP